MRLLCLHVQGFGTLRDLDEQFNDGLNVRLYPNGWGKSTLAVFIKAMLYGLPQSSRRSLIENERKRYQPWQGGVFGGSLDFETGGKSYRIERTFGVKAADDTLRVLSLDTGREVDESWAQEPGLSLFGVDADAYERSTYLSQRPDEYTKDGTLGIHTKLNRLVDATDDIANYDTAMAALDKRRLYYHLLKGEGGAIFQNQQRLDAVERDVELALTKLRSLDETRGHIQEIEERISAARRSLDETERSERELQRLREAEAVWERLRAQKAEIDELQSQRMAIERELGGALPDKDTLSELHRVAELEQQLHLALVRLQPNDRQTEEYDRLRAELGANAPSEQAKEQLRLAARRYHSAAALVTDEQRRTALGATDLSPEEQLSRVRQLCRADKSDDAPHATPSLTVFALVGGGLLTLALLLGSLLLPSLWIAAVAVLAVTALLTPICAARQKKSAARQQARQQDKELLARLLAEAQERVAFDREWQAAAPGADRPRGEEAYFQTERLISRWERLEQIRLTVHQQNQDATAVRKQLDELSSTLSELLAAMTDVPSDAREAVRRIEERMSRHAELGERLTRKREQLDALQSQYADDAMLAPFAEHSESSGTPLDLAARRDELSEQRLRMQAALNDDVQQLTRLQQRCEHLETAREELDELESERDELYSLIAQQKQSLDAIVLAQKYLTQAKESLSSRYLSTMKERFATYMTELTEDPSLDFTMNTHFEVSLRVMGSGRDTDSFSVGTRDLIAFCERLSLVDAMFEGERPFLILDDPFTNLDDETLCRAQALITRLSERYQLLYLSCHSGRVPHTKENA